MAKLRKGGSPTIMKGEHTGDKIGVDHVLPKSLVVELEARFYNLEAIPSKVNREGLLSAEGLQAVAAAKE